MWKSQSYKWIISSLEINQNELFFGGVNKYFYCVDIESGKTKWKFLTNGECYFPPAFSNDKIFFTSFDLFLYAVNREGKELWKYKLPNRVKSSPVYYSGLIIVSISNTGLLAIDAETGKQKWQFLQDITDLSPTRPVVSSDILLAGINDTLFALTLRSGDLIWKETFENTILSNPSVMNAAVVIGGFNPIDTEKTFISAVNIKTGKEIWIKQFDYNARYSPLADNGNVYFGTERSEIKCLDISNGEETWTTKLEKDGIGSEILSLNGKLFFSGYERNFYILDALTGRQLTQNSFDYGLGNPLLSKGNVYFGTGEGILYKVAKE